MILTIMTAMTALLVSNGYMNIAEALLMNLGASAVLIELIIDELHESYQLVGRGRNNNARVSDLLGRRTDELFAQSVLPAAVLSLLGASCGVLIISGGFPNALSTLLMLAGLCACTLAAAHIYVMAMDKYRNTPKKKKTTRTTELRERTVFGINNVK